MKLYSTSPTHFSGSWRLVWDYPLKLLGPHTERNIRSTSAKIWARCGGLILHKEMMLIGTKFELASEHIYPLHRYYTRTLWAASRPGPSTSVKKVKVLLRTSDKKTAWMAPKRNEVGQIRRRWALDGRLQTCGLESPKADFKRLQTDIRNFIKREICTWPLCVESSPFLTVYHHHLDRSNSPNQGFVVYFTAGCLWNSSWAGFKMISAVYNTRPRSGFHVRKVWFVQYIKYRRRRRILLTYLMLFKTYFRYLRHLQCHPGSSVIHVVLGSRTCLLGVREGSFEVCRSLFLIKTSRPGETRCVVTTLVGHLIPQGRECFRPCIKMFV
jgi:hypothetical protein